MIQIRNIVIAGLILMSIVGVGYLIYRGIEKRKEDEDFTLEIRQSKFKDELTQISEDAKRDSAQLVWELKIRSLDYRLHYSEAKTEKEILAFEDSMYLLDKYATDDDKRWYLKFKKNFHNNIKP